MDWTSTRERSAFRSIERVCHSGLDSIGLRNTLVQRLSAVVPGEVMAVGTLDPDTALMTQAGSALEPPGYLARFLDRAYLRGEAETMADLARSGRVVSTSPSNVMREFLRAEGLTHEMRVIFSSGGQSWGVFCASRESSSRPFGDGEVRFLNRIAPHVAHGLRMAVLVDMAASFTVGDREGDEAGGSHLTPAVIVVGSSGRLLHSSASARRVLGDLDEAGSVWPTLAPAVVSVLARLRERGDVADDATVRARGRSGRWYTIAASRSEPDALGDCAAIVLIAPVTRADVAPMLARLYGLTTREREVITAVARGESTKEISARLGISPYTVQDHLDHAFDKVGVRGRRALLARLFLDGTTV